MAWAPWQSIVVAISGWVNRQQQEVIDGLYRDNRVPREKLMDTFRPFGVLTRASGSLVAAACLGVVLLRAAAVSADQPSARLYDAPAEVTAGLSDKTLSQKSGWQQVREEDAAHRFKGCAVFLNDKVVAVLHAARAAVDLYSRQTRELKLCAQLCPLDGDGTEIDPASLAIKENTPSTVSLEVGLRSPGRAPRRIVYTLNVGEPFVKTAAQGAAKLRVRSPCRYAVAPDFFGDDIVVDAAALPVHHAEIPSENFLLHMMHDGQAIVR